jgi:hypothetical protein
MKQDEEELSSSDARFYNAYDGLDVDGVEFDSDVDEMIEDNYSDD